jgi:hypothetical protein
MAAQEKMTAQEKARAGLWLIEVAIRQLIREKGPKHPAETADALGIRCKSSESESGGGITYYVMLAMVAKGLLVPIDLGPKPAYDIAPGSTH